MKSSKVSPFVHWAQTEDAITLRIELRDVQSEPQVQLEASGLEFGATGTGASGVNEYSFKLDFYRPVNPSKSQYRVSERQVEFYVCKESPEQWPRLIQDTKKLAWLKVDFEKLRDIDDDDTEDDGFSQEDLFNNLAKDLGKKRKTQEQRVEVIRKMYLLLYNLFQLVGFTYIVAGMVYKYSRQGPDSMPTTYDNFGRVFRFCQLLQVMEVIHPLLGYTRGGIFFPIIQIGGRLFIIFLMIDAEERMQTKPAVFYIFLVYCVAEVIRYPYYILRIFNRNISFVTWVRYSAWIILYPLGFFCEGVIILRNIPYFEETGKFSVSFPNAWNFSFYFPTLLRIYLLLGCFPSMYMMMSNMYRQRVKVLKTKEPSKVKQK